MIMKQLLIIIQFIIIVFLYFSYQKALTQVAHELIEQKKYGQVEIVTDDYIAGSEYDAEISLKNATNINLERYGAVGFSIGNRGYIGTGRNDRGYKRDFWEYDPVSDSWNEKESFGDRPISDAVGFSIGNYGYVGTGFTGVDRKEFWMYDPYIDDWYWMEDFPGTPRRNAVGFSIGNYGYIGTGLERREDGTFWAWRDFFQYNPATDTWIEKRWIPFEADEDPTFRYGAVGFSIGNRGYIGTGRYSDSRKDFWEYNPDNNTWTQKAEFIATARYGAVGFSVGDKGYIGTGLGGGYRKDFWEYDPDNNTWTQKADFGGSVRMWAVSFSINDRGYIGTGRYWDGAKFVILKDFWEYDPNKNEWSRREDLGGNIPMISISSPTGGEAWYIGSKRHITWTSDHIDNINLQFSINNGSSWQNIATSVPASQGSYEWTVPDTPTEEAKVRICDAGDSDVCFGSRVFNISYNENRIITDIDGNTYKTIKIGEQWWMAENLRVSRYRNGDAIPTNLNDDEWQNTTYGAYAIYPHGNVDGINSDAEMVDAYGKLYNWYSVIDPRELCPEGWRVPSENDWQKLEIHLGMSEVDAVHRTGYRGQSNNVGGKLKSTLIEPELHPRWKAPNYGATNGSNFSGLPSGHRAHNGIFYLVGDYNTWWSITEYNTGNSWTRRLSYSDNGVRRYFAIKNQGCSVRCVKDDSELTLGAIQGTVYDNLGNPLENAEVNIYWPITRMTTTNSDGEYSFNYLPFNNNYAVEASKQGYGNQIKYNISVSKDAVSTINFSLAPTNIYISNITSNRTSINPNFDSMISRNAYGRGILDKFTLKAGANYLSTLNIGYWVEVEIVNNSPYTQRDRLYIGMEDPSGDRWTMKEYNSFMNYYHEVMLKGYEEKKFYIWINKNKHPFIYSPADEGEWKIYFRLNNLERDFDWDDPDLIIHVNDEPIINNKSKTIDNFINTLVLYSPEYFEQFNDKDLTGAALIQNIILTTLSILAKSSPITSGAFQMANDIMIAFQELNMAYLRMAEINVNVNQGEIFNVYSLDLDWEIKNKIINMRGNYGSYPYVLHGFFDRAVLVVTLEGDVNVIMTSDADDVHITHENGTKYTTLAWFYDGVDKLLTTDSFSESILLSSTEAFNYTAQIHLQLGPTKDVPGSNPETGEFVEYSGVYDYSRWIENENDVKFSTISLDAKKGTVFSSGYDNIMYNASDNRTIEFNFTTLQKIATNSDDPFSIKIIDKIIDDWDNSTGYVTGNSFMVESIGNNDISPFNMKIYFAENESNLIDSENYGLYKYNQNTSTWNLLSSSFHGDHITKLNAGAGKYVIAVKETKTIFGILKDYQTDNKIPGMDINLYRGGMLSDSTVTNEYGFFNFSHLSPGRYTFTIESDSWNLVEEYELSIDQNTPELDTLKLFITDGLLPPRNVEFIRQDSILNIDFGRVLNDTWSYKIYYDTIPGEGKYEGIGLEQGDSPFYIGNSPQVLLTGLESEQDYYFAFAIVDSLFNESIISREYYMPYDHTTNIELRQNIPNEFILYQNFPNPFNPTTTIKFTIPTESSTNITIYNILGQRIKTLLNKELLPGSYYVEWDATNDFGMSVSSGIYFYRIEAGNFIDINKMIYIK